MGDKQDRWTALRKGVANRIGQWIPTDTLQLQRVYREAQKSARDNAQNLLKSLSVSDDKIAEILERVRTELPTTEALLIGKPQAGKSSIVRGLTGVSDKIVGQGFRPHTQNTQRYAYPSEELPLLIFTDTVGLGDIGQDTDALVSELAEELKIRTPVEDQAVEDQAVEGQTVGSKISSDGASDSDTSQPARQRAKALKAGQSAARILVLTVKITDFAVDQLRLIVQQLRRQHPNVPCLLAVTCLHEIYPPDCENHPSYPPALPELTRAFDELKSALKGCFDRAVLIDFTLEEDGFEPVFYGQEALSEALAELLPEAEANAIYQLIHDQTEVGAELGNLYRDVGRRYISAFAVIAATLAAVPLPFATMPVLTALQVSMVGVLGQIYGQKLTSSQAGGVVSAIAGGFFAQAIGRELVKFIPGFGSVIAASWAAGYTWALGEGACAYFGDMMGGKTPDPERIEQVMQTAFEAAKERFRSA